jgi:hypothetical protein
MATTFALGDQSHAIPGRRRPFNLTLLRPTDHILLHQPSEVVFLSIDSPI